MKKTLMINLGGIVFHIDDDAYKMLNDYLGKLETHFIRMEGYREILDDIEARMAEILREKRPDADRVITAEDVKEVVATMGQPVEIDQEEEPGKSKMPGEGKGQKRFYRNPEEKVVGGVCSGIAAYLHVDPVWIRLLFVALCFAGGFGFLLYLILWIVIPEAQSTAERLEMRGRTINIRNIESSVREGLSGIGSKIGSMAGESAETIRRARTGSGEFFETAGKSLVEILRFLLRGMLILTGGMLVLIGFALLVVFAAYLLGWTGGIYADNDYTLLDFPHLASLTVGCNMPVVYLQAILLIFLGIPAFMLFYNGLRMVFRFNRHRYLILTMMNIWLVGLFFLAWSSLRIYGYYKTAEETRMEIPLEKPSCDTLTVSLIPDDPGMRYLRSEQYVLVNDMKTVITDDHELYLLPGVRVEESPDSLFSVIQVTHANGKSRIEAHQHLANIRFRCAASGTALRISPFVRLPRESCWRGQMVDLIIRVPRGKHVHFDKEIRDMHPYGYYWMDSDTGPGEMVPPEL